MFFASHTFPVSQVYYYQKFLLQSLQRCPVPHSTIPFDSPQAGQTRVVFAGTLAFFVTRVTGLTGSPFFGSFQSQRLHRGHCTGSTTLGSQVAPHFLHCLVMALPLHHIITITLSSQELLLLLLSNPFHTPTTPGKKSSLRRSTVSLSDN